MIFKLYDSKTLEIETGKVEAKKIRIEVLRTKPMSVSLSESEFSVEAPVTRKSRAKS